MHVIGIDRGERNLIYLSVINSKGEIVKQKSFNIVGNYNYQAKLVEKEHARDNARKSWKEIGKIAELKEGYLSQVIHEITELMLEYNAIIAMENLNAGFKRGRFKVERQVYQKFEKMLIDKLNYLVIKSESATNPGGVLRGYQLAYKVDNLERLGKQCGMIFYVPAAFTSKIDPTTGFADVFKHKELTSGKNKKEFLLQFDNISYDNEKDMFKFEFNYNNFPTYRVLPNTVWTAYSCGERVVKIRDKVNGTMSDGIVILTEELKKVFTEANIQYKDGHNLVCDIEKLDERNNLNVITATQYYFKLTMQMRNSLTNDESYDKIISPVLNANGEFFETNGDTEGNLPADADANGAYNIALKGLYMMNSIAENYIEGADMPKDVLKLTDAEWFDYIQNRRFEE